MLKKLLETNADSIGAIEENIMDGDEATVAEQAAELHSLCATLYTLFHAETPRDDRRTTVDALESIIADCNARIRELNAESLAELQLGIPVQGFKLKSASNTRTFTADAPTVLKEYLEPTDLYDMKLKGIGAVEKLLTAKGLKPAARQEVFDKCVTVSVGKESIVKEK